MDTNPRKASQGAPRVFCSRLWLKHALIAALISALVISLAGVALSQEKKRYRERSSVATQNIARLFDQQISGVIEKIDNGLLAGRYLYVEMLASGTLDGDKLNHYLFQQESLLPEIVSLRIIDQHGIVRFGRDVSMSLPLDLSDREYFQTARDNVSPGLIVHGPIFARISKEWVIVLARRLSAPDGSFAGVIYANLPCEHFEKILSLASLGPHGAAAIRMSDLALVHRFPDTKNAVGTKDVSPQLRQAVARSPNGGEYTAPTALDGIERSNVFRRLKFYPLYVIVGLATTDYLGGWPQSLLIIASLTGVTLLITWLATLRVYLSQRRLNEDIEKRTQIGHALEQVIAERAQLYTELENRKNALEQANVTLEQKVSERTFALSKVNQELERLARRDALTRVGNRLSADEHLHEEFLRMKRTGVVYSVLMIDIDHFKQVNDSHGHEQGDLVLRHIAGILTCSCRVTDFVARFGGEEFLVILPNTPLDDAIHVAQKVCDAIAASHAAPVGCVTVSIGVASATPADADETEALRAADAHLYRAKMNGRNQIASEAFPEASQADQIL
ncbi:MAG: signal transduction histidine kinase [Proteobacteria bacterium]|nr:signal transduction histidine kinase [Pseudomonadota bacterium]